MKRASILLAAVVAVAMSAAHSSAADVIELAVDVPTTLGISTFTPEQILRNQGVGYSVLASLPSGVGLSGLARTPAGPWLLAVTHPALLGGLEAEPRDVVQFDGTSFLLAVDGSTAGIPPGARIDALLVDPSSGNLLMSFDHPVTLGSTDYLASDLVALGAGFSLYWASAAAGVPISANLSGADLTADGSLVVTFEVPVDLDGTTFLPGQLVHWDGGTSFSLYTSPPAWPVSSRLSDFSFLPASGEVPDGAGGGTPLEVTEAGGGFLSLTWSASCASGDTDYEIYEGPLQAPFTGHNAILCSTGGLTSSTFLPSSGDRYYLVVPRNAVVEGSYGRDSSGSLRPPPLAMCLPQSVAPVCH